MNIEEFRMVCLSQSCARENAPWADPRYQNLITYTVAGKWFCLLNLETKACLIKCRPDEVIELQDRFMGIEPAWHMNKKHWIGLELKSDVPDDEIRRLVHQAYSLVVARLTKSARRAIGLL